MVILLIGVSGSGKTTIGKKLAESLGWSFFEGDQFHPPENIAKMSAGIPLTDEDRLPWLNTIHNLIQTQLQNSQSTVDISQDPSKIVSTIERELQIWES